MDDGSYEQTAKVVDKFKDHRINYIKNSETKGASYCRNLGIRNSQGEFIAFLDDDDEWLPQKLSKQSALFAQSDNSVGLLYSWLEYFDDKKSLGVLKPELRGDIFKETLSKQPIGGCPSLMIRRAVVEKVGFFNEQIKRGDDGDYIRRISKYFFVDYVPEILVNVYIGHQDRMSIITRQNCQNAIFELKHRLIQFKTDFTEFPAEKDKVLLKIFYHSLYILNFQQAAKYLFLYFTNKSKINIFNKIVFIFSYFYSYKNKFKLKSL